jgi:hypothetical protein
MNKQRKTSHILNVFQYDDDGHVVLPASLTLSIAPGADLTNEDPKVQAIANAIWTEEIIETYLTFLLSNNQ